MTTRFVAETILKDTGKAVLIVHRGVNTWLPQSQVENYDFMDDGSGRVIFAVSDWIAEQKGISDETEEIKKMAREGLFLPIRRRSEKPPPYKPPPPTVNPSEIAAPELDIPDAVKSGEPKGDVFMDVKPAPSKKVVRVFLAHAKGTSEATIEVMKSNVIRIFTEKAAGRASIAVVTGFDDWGANFKRAGGWDAWARDVVERIDYATRERVYSVIVVTDSYLGKATAQIVSFALKTSPRMPCFYLNGPKLEQIVRVDLVDPNSFRAGWRVIVEEAKS